MSDILTELAPFSGVGLGGLVSLIILLMLTDRLVWHKRLEKEEARTAKAQEQTERALALIEGVGGQVEKLTEAVSEGNRDSDLAVTILAGLRKHLGIEEGGR